MLEIGAISSKGYCLMGQCLMWTPAAYGIGLPLIPDGAAGSWRLCSLRCQLPSFPVAWARHKSSSLIHWAPTMSAEALKTGYFIPVTYDQGGKSSSSISQGTLTVSSLCQSVEPAAAPLRRSCSSHTVYEHHHLSVLFSFPVGRRMFGAESGICMGLKQFLLAEI